MKKPDLSRNTLFLICVVIVSVVLRIFHLCQYAQLPVFDTPVTADASEYWNDALNILHGGRPLSAIHAPLYPYFLALLVRVSGGHVFCVRLIQSLLALGAGLFLHRVLASRFRGMYDPMRYVPELAFCFYALSPTLIAMQSEFFAENLSTACLLMSVYFLYAVPDRRASGNRMASPSFRRVSAILGGLCGGIAILTHPMTLFFPFVVALGMLWLALSDRPRFKRLLRRNLLFFLVLLLTVSCYVVPRSVSAGRFVPVQQGSMFNFWLGNHIGGPYTPGICSVPPGDRWHDVHDSVSSDAEFFGRTFQSWADELSEGHARSVLVYGLKLFYPVAACELTTWSDVSPAKLTWIHRYVYHTSWLLLIPAIAAVILFFRSRSFRGRCEPLLILAFAFYLAQAALVSAGRYRMPMLPACAGLAAYFLCALPVIVRKSLRRKTIYALAIAIVAVILGTAPVCRDKLHRIDSERVYATACLADAALRIDEPAKALGYLLDMPEWHRASVANFAAGTFAAVFMELGNYGRAAEYLPKPGPDGRPPEDCPPSLLACLGRLYAETERPALAEYCYVNSIDRVDRSQRITTMYNYGVLLQSMDSLDKAAQCYHDIVDGNPLFVKAWSNLGVIAMVEERYDHAVEYFRTACELDPGNPRRVVNYAAALVSAGRLSAARDALAPLVSSGSLPDYALPLLDALNQ